ncbi:MAG: hypothetical protein DRH10_08600 [Deltaproteobacteria bacterium]|nr:MAG: hypothetical protein DRH10_08600 [Deltaproteobacteria bacterium]
MYKKKEVPTQSIGTRIGFSLLKSYFDMIPHEGLIKRLSEKRGSDAEHRNQDKKKKEIRNFLFQHII